MPDQSSQKLSQLFFYLQDISLELQSSSALLQITKSIYDDAPFRVNLEENVFAEYQMTFLKPINPQTLNTLPKLALHSIILNICKFAEAVTKSGCGKLLKEYCPKSLTRFNRMISEMYSDAIKEYRNRYLAHPINNQTNNFASRSELIELLKKILDISNINQLSIYDLLTFIQKLFHTNETDPDKSIAWAIFDMEKELTSNGIQLKRI